MAIIIIQRNRAARFSGKVDIPNSPKILTKPKTRIMAMNLTCLAGPLYRKNVVFLRDSLSSTSGFLRFIPFLFSVVLLSAREQHHD